jgi:hypothetical protein
LVAVGLDMGVPLGAVLLDELDKLHSSKLPLALPLLEMELVMSEASSD